MNEDLLQYIWKIWVPVQKELYTVSGEPIVVLQKGIQNTLSGPDFAEAKIKIGQTIWAGNVEIHYKSSNWNQHQHQKDIAYNNVILHVVWLYNIEVYTESGFSAPVLELSKFISEDLIQRYQSLISNSKLLPCSGYINQVDNEKLKIWLSKMAFERLQEKSTFFKNILETCNNNWEEAFVRLYIASMGFNSNKVAFEILANQVNYNHLLKIRDQVNAVEAYLFGLCGFLDANFLDDYPNALKKEWQFLKEKYQFKEILRGQLKFGGVRPLNYPTIRIAQIAAVIKKNLSFLDLIINARNFQNIINGLSAEPNLYWKNHFVFDKQTEKQHNSTIGIGSINLLMINFIAPSLYIFNQYHKPDFDIDEIFSIFEAVKEEKNRIVALFKKENIPLKGVIDTQSVIHLYRNYCTQKKCIKCIVGTEILQKNGTF